NATLILNNHFAVDDCGSAVKLSCSLCYPAVTLCPIQGGSGVGACFATLDNQEGAIAVMLDFMNPACTRRRLIDCGCELRADKLKRHTSLLSEAQQIASPASGKRDSAGSPGCVGTNRGFRRSGSKARNPRTAPAS